MRAVGHTQLLTLHDSFAMPDSNTLNAVVGQVVPDTVLRMAVRGYADYRRGRLESAEQLLLRVVEIEPDFAEAHMCLSEIERKLGKPGESASHLKIANQLGNNESIDD
jgi:Tfp pilus assembly protein PilF